MAERRTDDSPIAPARSLSGPSQEKKSSDDPKPPLAERAKTAITSAGSAVAAAASSGPAATKEGTSVTEPRPSKREEAKARKTAAKQAATPAPTARPKTTRRARLRLIHLDPWSVMKTSFLLSIAFGIVTVVAVAVVWSVLGAAGVWESINTTVGDVMGGDTADTFDIQTYVGMSRVLGFTMIVAVVDVVLITAIATLAAFLYNLAAALLGGVEVTLAEDDR